MCILPGYKQMPDADGFCITSLSVVYFQSIYKVDKTKFVNLGKTTNIKKKKIKLLRHEASTTA